MKRLVLLLCVPLMGASWAPAASISGFHPLGGKPGDVITVYGNDLNTAGSLTVTLGEANASAQIIDSDSLRFTVPSGAASGPLQLLSNGSLEAESPYPFQVRREIHVSLNLPGILPHTYTLASGQQVAETSGSGGVLVVPADTATLIWAVPGTDDARASFFAAVALPKQSEVTVDTFSTAVSLPFLSPYLGTREGARSEALANLLEGLTETGHLEQTIVEAVQNNIPYIDDARVEAALADVIEAALSATPPASQSAEIEPQRTMASETVNTGGLTIESLNPDYAITKPRLELVPRNLSEALGGGDVPNAHLLTLKTTSANPAPLANTNPLDWFVEIYEVHPRAIPGGLSSLATLSHDDPLEFLDERPLASGRVPADLGASNVDLFGNLGAFLTKQLNSLGPTRLNPNDFLFDRDTYGVYVVQAYSGNLWYGTGFFLATTNQVTLLDQVDPNDQWSAALTTNIVLTAFDVVALAVDVQDYLGEDALIALAQSTFINVNKTIAAHDLTEGLTAELALEILTTTEKTILQGLAKHLLAGGAKQTFSRLLKGVTKTAVKVFDITGKISSVEQVMERSAGFLLPNALGIERYLVVVNNPFTPRIRSFSPTAGKGGEGVQIDGLGFGFPKNWMEDPNGDISVSLCTFSSTTTDPHHQEPPTAQLELPLGTRHENRLTVGIPSDFGETFPEGAYFCVSTEAGISVSAEKFGYIPPPSLTAVQPEEIFYYNHLSLTGENLQPNSIVVIDDYWEYEPTHQTSDRLTVIFSRNSPPNVGEHTVKVKTDAHETQSLPFTVKSPTQAPPDEVINGVTIYVTTGADMVAEDGQMSLREAILIANGNRGALIERHTQCELDGDCPWRNLDIDNVTGINDNIGRMGGPAQIDTINVRTFVDVITLDSDLPPLGPWDTVNLNLTHIQGGNTAGLTVSGGSGLRVRNATIDGGSTAGLHVTHDTNGAIFTNLSFTNCGTGIQVDQDSDGNSFADITVEAPASHGIHLSGGSDGNAIIRADITNAGGHGIFLEGAAEQNQLLESEVHGSALSGVCLSGSGVRYNHATNQNISLDDTQATYAVRDIYNGNAEYGLLIENGASFNLWGVRHLMENRAGGVCIRGTGTSYNVVGKTYRFKPENAPIPSLIYFNEGPGVLLSDGASHNTVRTFNIVANQGDGVVIDNAHDNILETILTGEQRYFYDPETYSEPPPAPNGGNSIRIAGGASRNRVTAPPFTDSWGDLIMPNLLQFDEGNGILIEGAGTDENFIHGSIIREIGTVATIGESPPPSDAGNGIEIRGGAANNRIGEPLYTTRILIDDVAGAGILIRDAATIDNTVSGCHTSWEPDAPLHDSDWAGCGVYLYDGARGNRIGVPGPTDGRSSLAFGPSDHTNSFSGAVAGLVIDGAGGSVNHGGERQLPNVIASNSIHGPVGLLIRGGAEVNDIGGEAPPARGFVLLGESWMGDANGIGGTIAAVKVDSTPLSHPTARNRFMNNVITGGVSSTPDPVPPLVPVPEPVGLLITGDSDGHIFGESWRTLNSFDDVAVGIYIDGCTGVEVYAAELGYWTWGFEFPANLVLNEAEDCIIGSSDWMKHNYFGYAGVTDNGNTGNVIIIGGSGNRIAGNIVEYSNSHGILLESGSSNRIGGPDPLAGNTIIANKGSGVLVKGPNAFNNIIQGNWIGEKPDGSVQPNQGHGIHLVDQTSGTLIGGTSTFNTSAGTILAPAPNIISHNLGYGVEVTGSGSVANSILHNSIYANELGGIRTANNGNEEIPPPTEVLYSAGTATGEVDLETAPAGSRVQLFSDSDLQGEIFLGEAEVLPGGSWTVTGLAAAPLPNINATVTDPDGNTSEFAQGAVSRGFQIARADGAAPGEQTVAFSGNPFVVLPLVAEATGDDVRVDSLTFSATGELNDAVAVAAVQIYRDADSSGSLTPADSLLSPEDAVYDSDNGTVTVNMGSVVIRAGSPEEWLLVYQPGTGAAEGETFDTRLASPTAVAAAHVLPANLPATPQGIFPILSDFFTVGASTALAYAEWGTLHFGGGASDPGIGGVHADPDGDGLGNALEFAFGLDPTSPDSGLPIEIAETNNRLRLTFRFPANLGGVQYHPAASPDLTDWDRNSPLIESTEGPFDEGDGTHSMTTLVNPGPDGNVFGRIEVDISP